MAGTEREEAAAGKPGTAAEEQATAAAQAKVGKLGADGLQEALGQQAASETQKAGESQTPPLYRTETVYTEAEYLRFAKTVQRKVGRAWLKAGLCSLCFLVLGLLSWADSRTMACVYVVAALLFPFLLQFSMDRRLKKAYASNQSLQGMHYELRFYADHLETSGSIGFSTLPYAKLYRILETETNFYLLVSRNQGVVLQKENCTPELIQFVRGLQKT